MKVAVLFANFGPYHLARFGSFQESCHQLGWQAVGIELARQEIEYPWETEISLFSHSIISVIKEQKLEQTRVTLLVKKLIATLNQINPDIVAISGYARPTMLASLLWSLWHKKQTILFSESKEDDANRSWWQEKFKSKIIQLYQAALVGGKPHQRYLEKLGMRAEAIFAGYDVVGNNIFSPSNLQHLPNLINQPYFLTVNRFVTKKNLLFLLTTYATYCQKLGDRAWDLVLCGDGELRPQIEAKIAQLNLQHKVHLPGFLQQEELLPYFAHASCFIHASTTEQWGLVVNEAMAAGLPVLISNRCGCFEDLVIEGVNGFGFDPLNSQQLTNLMLQISSENVDQQKMGQAALEHIQNFSPEYFAQGLTQAVKYAMASR
ncbi:MAG: glycosyltransferase [Xenococcaceae cyanobacterium]